MEIERKFLIKQLPEQLESYPSHLIEQAYLNVQPVVRVRREDDRFYMTYKGGGMMAREEYNLPLDAASYSHLLGKADGNIITKRRYLIPCEPYTIELDIFEGIFKGMIIAEVEFPTIAEAEQFVPPDWFGEDVTFDGHYHNSYMSRVNPDAIRIG
ncbi:MAG: CYTH domain-containing protein [Coprococcus sp.]